MKIPNLPDIFFSITLLACISTFAATYYVAANGNDSANGTSVQTPWATPGKAARTVRAGAGKALSVSPNPFNAHSVIHYVMASAGRAEIRIFREDGRAVRTLLDNWQPAGAHDLGWDGRDGQGRRLGKGVYIARLRAAGKAQAVRMFLSE